MDIVRRGLAKRYRAERRFKAMGVLAIGASLLFLAMLFVSIAGNGYTAFQQTHIRLEVSLEPEAFEGISLSAADYAGLVKKSLRRMFPEVSGRGDLRQLYALVSSGAGYRLREMVMARPQLVGQTLPLWVPADDDVDMLIKGHFGGEASGSATRLSDSQRQWIDRLKAEGKIEKRFNRTFFTTGDSREPELAGIRGAVAGSFFTLVVTLALSFPIGVAAAIYLEEFAPRNRWTDLIEVNINNLAAVPSIVFGLLGLAVFLNFFGLPRSAPLVGGLVLTLMTLPTIMIASRAALKSVPPSIREGA
ncbi:MAG: DUF3333 domain-containing protein, partial [Desulfobacteraceae bacterium]|nr:DUF3333 domain-containing protein [Desulfobacteraceae bacterium]